MLLHVFDIQAAFTLLWVFGIRCFLFPLQIAGCHSDAVRNCCDATDTLSQMNKEHGTVILGLWLWLFSGGSKKTAVSKKCYCTIEVLIISFAIYSQLVVTMQVKTEQ